MGFAENVRSELEFQDIQIKELAEKSGISKNTLDKYLSGRKVQPGVENAVKIAQVLGVSVEYLTDGKESALKTASSAIPLKYQKLIEQYRTLNSYNQNTIEDLLNSLCIRQ